MSRVSLLLSFVALATACTPNAKKPAERSPASKVRHSPVRLAAAADLALVLEEIKPLFEQRSDETLSVSLGSTGLLAKQIAEGAPFDVFAAANLSFVDEVVRRGRCEGRSQHLYARGRIVVWTSKGKAALSLRDLASPAVRRIAIANPEHAPYGRAALEAFRKEGIAEKIQSKLVYGENVRQALQFAESGNADAAVLALSLVARRARERWVPIDEALHAPIDQALVVCKEGKNAAGGRKFVDFLASQEGRRLMETYGFLPPPLRK